MPLSSIDADYVRTLVRERSAIVLDESKQYLIESRLGPVARQHGLDSLEDLLSRARSDPSGALQTRVVDALTTNETSFFRDVHPWSVLEHTVLPTILRSRVAERRLTVWSAGCSSGQESYSLAMLLLDRFPEVAASWDVRILGTDLSTEMVERADRGDFTQLEVNRGLPAPLLVRHFRRENGTWRISEDVRRLVEFRTLNLCRPWPVLPPVDLVLLRNVLIYFDLDTKRQMLERVRGVLRPEGWLFLGAAETTLNIDDRFTRWPFEGTTAYRPR